MLPPPYAWRNSDAAAYLDWRYGNVASVTPKDGKWQVTIRWRGRVLGGPCGSQAQGVRFVEAWVARRGLDWPSVRPVRWYDRVTG